MWKLIDFRTDIHNHCQRCNRATSRLFWYQMNPQQVATICEECNPTIQKQIADDAEGEMDERVDAEMCQAERTLFDGREV